MNVLVTAGPTREAIDPVRFLSNRSSGKMGYAIARAFRRRGYAVRLVSGPTGLLAPAGVDVIPVVTAAEMAEAVQKNVAWCDVLVMAAAVADWRPARVARRKLKKSAGAPVIRMVPTVDILRSIKSKKRGRFFVGFAAETGAGGLGEARRKLVAKNLDLIVLNDVLQPGAGFEGDTNRVVLLTRDGRPDAWPLLSKDRVAARLVCCVERSISRRRSG